MNIDFVQNKCCGCGLCINICPSSCIHFVLNDEGFMYPKVDSSCIDCGLCVNNCISINDLTLNEPAAQFYGKTLDEDIYKNAASGGLATALSSYFVDHNGVVYGCRLNRDFKTEHFRCENATELLEMQGSKYTQSNINEVYDKVKSDLTNNRSVLFFGTPCQVASIKQFCNNSELLICVDLICHGVTNDVVLSEYIHFLETKYDAKVENYKFRSKSTNHRRTEEFDLIRNGTIIKKYNDILDSPLNYGYINNSISRLSCYSCKFKSSKRIGDLSLGDYWETNNSSKQQDWYGYSSIYINTKKGEDLINQIKSLEMHPMKNNLTDSNTPIPGNRSMFFYKLNKCDDDKWDVISPSYYYLRKLYSALPNELRLLIYKWLK